MQKEDNKRIILMKECDQEVEMIRKEEKNISKRIFIIF